MPAVTLNTVGDVIARACANLNDRQQSIWTDAAILPHVQSAVSWLSTLIANVSSPYFEKVQGAPYSDPDIQYTAGMCELTDVLPGDIYEPVFLDFRLSSGEQWQPMTRVTRLQANVPAAPQLLTSWEWSGRTLRVQPASSDCLIRLRYLGLMPQVNDNGDEIPIDNCVSALAFATAAFAYASRGQATQANVMWGSEEGGKTPPSGARMFAGMVLDIIVKNEQLVPRRPVPFSGGGVGTVLGYPVIQ